MTGEKKYRLRESCAFHFSNEAELIGALQEIDFYCWDLQHSNKR